MAARIDSSEEFATDIPDSRLQRRIIDTGEAAKGHDLLIPDTEWMMSPRTQSRELKHRMGRKKPCPSCIITMLT